MIEYFYFDCTFCNHFPVLIALFKFFLYGTATPFFLPFFSDSVFCNHFCGMIELFQFFFQK